MSDSMLSYKQLTEAGYVTKILNAVKKYDKYGNYNCNVTFCLEAGDFNTAVVRFRMLVEFISNAKTTYVNSSIITKSMTTNFADNSFTSGMRDIGDARFILTVVTALKNMTLNGQFGDTLKQSMQQLLLAYANVESLDDSYMYGTIVTDGKEVFSGATRLGNPIANSIRKAAIERAAIRVYNETDVKLEEDKLRLEKFLCDSYNFSVQYFMREYVTLKHPAKIDPTEEAVQTRQKIQMQKDYFKAMYNPKESTVDSVNVRKMSVTFIEGVPKRHMDHLMLVSNKDVTAVKRSRAAKKLEEARDMSAAHDFAIENELISAMGADIDKKKEKVVTDIKVSKISDVLPPTFADEAQSCLQLHEMYSMVNTLKKYAIGLVTVNSYSGEQVGEKYQAVKGQVLNQLPELYIDRRKLPKEVDNTEKIRYDYELD